MTQTPRACPSSSHPKVQISRKATSSKVHSQLASRHLVHAYACFRKNLASRSLSIPSNSLGRSQHCSDDLRSSSHLLWRCWKRHQGTATLARPPPSPPRCRSLAPPPPGGEAHTQSFYSISPGLKSPLPLGLTVSQGRTFFGNSGLGSTQNLV